MSQYGNTSTLSILAVLLALAATLRPAYFSESNAFLKAFFDQDIIMFLGLVLTISIGFLAQLFISVGQLKRHLSAEDVSEIRSEIRSTARYLVYLFVASIFLVFLKYLNIGNEIAEIFFNCSLIWVAAFYLLILGDVVLAIFDFDI